MQTMPDLHASPRYLSCAETAAILRKTLRARFPSTKFSVRSDTYSGGASIDVSYTDGPLTADVDAIAQGFAGGRFDGMIDLAYSVTSWLLPNGTAALAHSPGTESSRGSNPSFIGDPPHPGATLVRFGADYVFVRRDPSPATAAAIEADLRARYAMDPNDRDPRVTLDGKTALHAAGGWNYGHGVAYLSELVRLEFHAVAR